MIHTANEFTAKHNRHILFQVAAGLKALPPPGPGRPDTSSLASDNASAATHTHMDKAGFILSIFMPHHLVTCNWAFSQCILHLHIDCIDQCTSKLDQDTLGSVDSGSIDSAWCCDIATGPCWCLHLNSGFLHLLNPALS